MKDVIVVGGGFAGLSAAMRLAENGCRVKIFSVTKVKQVPLCLRARRHQRCHEPQR